MSRKERKRMTIMAGVTSQERTQVQAGELMGLGYRQTKRVWRRYQDHQFPRLHLRQFLALYARHDRHPFSFVPTHCQCLHVTDRMAETIPPKRDISIKLR